MNDVSIIWYHLNQAVSGRYPVYDLACKMVGLDKDVIYDICDKIYNDLHHQKKIRETTDTDGFVQKYKDRIKQERINKIIKDI